MDPAWKVILSKLGGGQSWKKHRLADDLVVDGRRYTVDLVARKATGVQGYRMTIVYLPRESGEELEAELPNARSTVDVHRTVRELSADPERLVDLARARA